MKWIAAWFQRQLTQFFLRHFFAYLQELDKRYDNISRQLYDIDSRLKASKKLPCFVVVRGTDSKDQPIEFASGIEFLAQGEKCQLKIQPQKDALNLKVYIEAPFVITDAKVGNRSFSWSESSTGECAFRELSIFECKVGMHITVEARYPGEETEGFT